MLEIIPYRPPLYRPPIIDDLTGVVQAAIILPPYGDTLELGLLVSRSSSGSKPSPWPRVVSDYDPYDPRTN